MDYLNAFWVGGLICALVQILLDIKGVAHISSSIVLVVRLELLFHFRFKDQTGNIGKNQGC